LTFSPSFSLNQPVPLLSPRRIVIGDVHGHYDTLLRLCDAFSPGQGDAVYFIGDLIDRGPNSAEVVDFVIKNKYHCLLGNHEQMLLDAIGGEEGEISPQLLQSWLYSGGHPTLVSYQHQIPQEHVDWMKQLPLYLDLGDIWLVHAGLDPRLPLDQQSAEQFCWIRDRFHCHPVPYFVDKLIITGHTITFTFPGVEPGQLACGAGWLDIDTGAYHPQSGWLTALDITNRWVYQVQASTNCVRTLPLDEAVTFMEPSNLLSKRGKSKRKGWFG
jgi:serine/threonine protein phosphatase 1